MSATGGQQIAIHREDGPLGQWTVASCRPDPDLADLIDTLWYGEGRVSYQSDRILPSGSSHLLINLGPPQYLLGPTPGSPLRPFRDIWLSGPQQRPLDTTAPHGQALLGIAFNPAGVTPWLREAGVGVANAVTALSDLLGDGADALRLRLLDCARIEQRFAVVQQWLRHRRGPRGVPPALNWSLQRLADSRGQLAIDQLAKELGYSRKYLAALFREHVGLSAKALARLYRFNAAIRLLRGCERVPWVELAAHCGYYDQSHLIRDFRDFSGFAPGEFLRRAQPDGGSIVLS